MMTKNKRKIIAFIAVLILAFGCTSCATYDAFVGEFIDTEQTEDVVRIGVFQPLSGSLSEYGELEKIGIELAHSLYPTCLNKKVELVYEDNKSDMDVAETTIQDLIAKRPAIVLGSYGSVNSLIAAEYLEEAKIPAIAITNDSPLVTSNHPYYFRVCYADSYQGTLLGKYAFEGLGTTTAGIFRQKDDDAVLTLTQSFSDKLAQMSGNPNAVALELEYDSGMRGLNEQLQSFEDAGIKTVFLPANTKDSLIIIKKAKQLGINLLFIGCDKWDTEEFAKGIGDAENMIAFSTLYDASVSSNYMSEMFLKAYKKEYGANAVPESAVALAFDAYLIAIENLNKVGTALDGEKLQQSLALTSNFAGASGNITFDENGDPIKTVNIKGIKNGKAEIIYTIEPQLVVLGE